MQSPSRQSPFAVHATPMPEGPATGAHASVSPFIAALGAI
jgi:hypothetical protein